MKKETKFDEKIGDMAVASSTTPSKLRELHPQKLELPPQVIEKMKQRDKEKMPNNPVLRFFKIFFGEGF